MRLLCILFGHRRRGNKVWHDMVDWRSVCARCDQCLIRDNDQNKWREFTMADESEDRKPRERA